MLKRFATVENFLENFTVDLLFEMNDEVLWHFFRKKVKKHLKKIADVKKVIVICDEYTNTPEVVDASAFRADVYVLNRKNLFIRYNVIASDTGVLVNKFYAI